MKLTTLGLSLLVLLVLAILARFAGGTSQGATTRTAPEVQPIVQPSVLDP